MILYQIFITPKTDDNSLRMLNGLCKVKETYPVYAVSEEKEKVLIADDRGELGWFYFHCFKVVKSITRIIQDEPSPAELIATGQPMEMELKKTENPLLDNKDDVKQNTKKGTK